MTSVLSRGRPYATSSILEIILALFFRNWHLSVPFFFFIALGSYIKEKKFYIGLPPSHGTLCDCMVLGLLKIADGGPDRIQYTCRAKEGGPVQLKVVIFTREQKRKVFQDVHDSSRGGAHMGITKTIAKTTERFYCIGIKKDVVNWTGECDWCQRSEKMKTVTPVLYPIKSEGPWQMVDVDLMGP